MLFRMAVISIYNKLQNNPLIIPRNHKLEEALESASLNDDLLPILDLLKFLKSPYKKQPGLTDFQNLPEPNNEVYKTFCGT